MRRRAVDRRRREGRGRAERRRETCILNVLYIYCHNEMAHAFSFHLQFLYFNV